MQAVIIMIISKHDKIVKGHNNFKLNLTSIKKSGKLSRQLDNKLKDKRQHTCIS